MCGFQHQRHRQYEDRPAEMAATDVMTVSPSEPDASGDYRVSAAERDAVIEELRDHAGAGRLTLDEFGERTEEALAAKTRSQLGRVLRELPRTRRRGQAGLAGTARGARRTTAWLRRLPLPLLVVACVAVAAVAMGHWWVIFPLLWFGGGILGPRHHRPDRADARV